MCERIAGMDDPVDPWFAPEPRQTSNRFDALWKSRLLGWVLILLASLRIASWHFDIPSAGKAVAALAVAAAIMSLRPEATGLERSAWMLVIGGFLWIELRAIDKDHIEAAAAAAGFQTAEDTRFAGILAQNQKEFDATMQDMGRLRSLAARSLTEVTGEGSYVVITGLRTNYNSKSDPQQLVFSNPTKVQARDISVQIFPVAPPNEDITAPTFMRDYGWYRYERIGNVPVTPPVYSNIMLPVGSYSVFVSAGNGSFFEALRMVRCPNGGVVSLATVRDSHGKVLHAADPLPSYCVN
jgi:hypothetical protein